MSDFAAFADQFSSFAKRNWPIIRVDLIGRGHARKERRHRPYSTLQDASDMAEFCRALGIDDAIWFGQGHGGQVIMALAAQHPSVIAGAILCDAGPIINARGLVRLRNNLAYLSKLRGQNAIRDSLRRILRVDYPNLGDGTLDQIGARTHVPTPKARLEPRFDMRLADQLNAFDNDDVLQANWHLFDALGKMPILLIRTQHTDLLRAEVFQMMCKKRPEALNYEIKGEGSPALLEGADELGVIADFVLHTCKWHKKRG
ncbi:alpha/beta hydrolase [Maritalea sp. P4.10X]|uniref:Alpha/beta hydrolase n=2 Tax=Maritalea mediterranea TaxID=2909667 RepID=A0ABS9E7K3_9HYPH|nr:alpha/beta hydrolase [Maritalea mediterranea]